MRLQKFGVIARENIVYGELLRTIHELMPYNYSLIEVKTDHGAFKIYTHFEGVQVIDEIFCLEEYRKAFEYSPCTVVDLGAHIGTFTLLAINIILNTYGDGLIASVEPASINYVALLNNVRLNNVEKYVYPIRVAVASRPGLAEIEWIGMKERAVQYLAEEQARLGHDVTAITSNIDVADSPKEETINGVKVVRLKSRRLLYNDLTIPLEEPSIKDVDIIHAHSQNSLFSIIVTEKLKAKSSGKVAFHFMAVEAFKSHPNFLIRLLAPYYGRRNTRKALKLADIPLVRNIRDLEVLRERYGVEAQYLPDAVPEHYFIAEKADPNEFREKFGIKQKKFFLYVGRMHKLKGPHVLVEAMKHISEDCATVFVGPDSGYLEKTLSLARRLGVEGKIYYLGHVDERAKIEALDSAVALVLPSIADHVEVYPMVISEAWAREKPVIASKVGGVSYRVKQGVNGLLVDPLNPKALAEAMTRLAEDEELAEEMGKNGRREVFSWREIAEKSVQLYEQVLRSG